MGYRNILGNKILKIMFVLYIISLKYGYILLLILGIECILKKIFFFIFNEIYLFKEIRCYIVKKLRRFK